MVVDRSIVFVTVMMKIGLVFMKKSRIWEIIMFKTLAWKMKFQIPFIGIDGCFLKGPFRGMLMSAVRLDGNNGFYPFTVAVVESETNDSWKWFLDHLHKFLGDTATNMPWTFMSDGQKGILTALSAIFAQAITRRCCKHIYANFRTRWPGVKYKKLFWEAINAYNEEDFKIAMRQIESISQDASNWLMEHPLETWTRHKFDDRVKCDYVTNNHVESFNSWLGNVRAKPITAVFECIRTKLMSKFNKRFQRTTDWTTIVVPKIKRRLNSNISKVGTCELTWPAEVVYEVTDNAKQKSYIVMLGERTCCCREWQVSGVPCMHACAAITTTRVDIEKLCSDFYNKDTYTKTYTPFIHPMRHESMWTEVEKPELDPLEFKRPCGRPRMSRKREDGEAEARKRSTVVQCSVCGHFGHNKRGCQKLLLQKRLQVGQQQQKQLKANQHKALRLHVAPGSRTYKHH
ncbi:uncharacterized protein LOC132272902 [Cornus florida]|uniref:uncharacterized protein LOC132272902 n=1 Tax=Cornus florida TaxID=4283 RepID=UPI00289B7522|nr:uncharacterized protein LOC132272902 [Cornus florida]